MVFSNKGRDIFKLRIRGTNLSNLKNLFLYFEIHDSFELRFLYVCDMKYGGNKKT